MPILHKGNLQIDYTDSRPDHQSENHSNQGKVETVILIHSSVSSNRQWRSLTEALQDRCRVLAVNLFGYGETTPWPQPALQTLYAQAQLVFALYEDLCTEGERVHLVGHSFGGSVAIKAALLMADWVETLILLEPNSFFLLKQAGRTEAFLEAQTLRDHVKFYGALADWENVAERFANYWLGSGAWQNMPEKRKTAFIRSVPPVFYEWDAMDEEATIASIANIKARTMVVSAQETQRPIYEVVELMRRACSHWTFRTITQGGHMAPLTHPEVIDPIVSDFLDGTAHSFPMPTNLLMTAGHARFHLPQSARSMTPRKQAGS